jgi:hypothetical protein
VLWQRFASVLDVPAERFDTTQDQQANLSIGYVETEMLRKVNRILREQLDEDARKSYVLAYLANEILRPDPTSAAISQRPILPPDVHDWSIRRSTQIVEDIRALGVQVVGDLDELVPRPLTPEERDRASTAWAPEVPDEVATVVSKLVTRIAELERASIDPSVSLKPSKGQKRHLRKARRLAQTPVIGDEDTMVHHDDSP